jgi:4-hydroxy-tetrahydrodipicolinate reductase
MKLAVVGAGGRMGQAILRLAREDGSIELVGASDAPGSPDVGRDVGEVSRLGVWGVALSGSVEDALLGAEVCIDFSSPRATASVARACARARVALVSGTTGLPEDALQAIDEAARSIPVLWAPNTSAGVQVLAELVREAVARLGPGYDIEVVEVHHRRKADAPSGTALRLVEAAREGREGLTVVAGREGTPGARKAEEIGVFAVRGGDVIGDHAVHLLGDGERIELTHRATSRDLFARGALRAARFLLGKAPGRYTMRDVIAGSLYCLPCLTILLLTAPATTAPATTITATTITATTDAAKATGEGGGSGARRARSSSTWSCRRSCSPRRTVWCGRRRGI